MASIDIFNDDAFGLMEMTDAVNAAPYKPRLLGSLGLFKEKPIRTTVAWVERKQNKLAVISTAPRGTMKDVRSTPLRDARPFQVPHVPYYQDILADDIQNVRAFDTESELEVMSEHVNEQLEGMRDDHEVTHEYHRVGALKGVVLDADGTTELYDFYDEFDVVQQTQDFVGSEEDLAPVIVGATRKIATALGNIVPKKIVALCGDTWFDAFVRHPSIKEDYKRWMDGGFLRAQYLGPEWYALAENGVQYQNVLFLNYRGEIGDLEFIPDDEAYFFPIGVPGMFQTIVAPGDMIGLANTRGRLIYASKDFLPHNKGVQLHTQSNALMINTRPGAVVKSTYTAEEES